MDIYSCFELGVDFYDMNTGEIYQIQQYRKMKMMGLPTPGVSILGPSGDIVAYWEVDKDPKCQKILENNYS